jgi:DNA repair protein RadD
MITLRNYQNTAVSSIRKAFTKLKNVLFVLPTGGGKTVIFTYLAWKSSQKNKRVLILVHRIELLRQVSRALNKFNVDHGIINPNYTPAFHKNVQVASIQTVINKLNYLTSIQWEADLIITDECFTGNTLIDGKRIDSIKIGDIVKSFNHESLQYENKEVVDIYEREYSGDWYKVNYNGTYVICTENHPFYIADLGYIAIKEIVNLKHEILFLSDEERCMSDLQQRNGEIEKLQKKEILRFKMLWRINKKINSFIAGYVLRSMRKEISVLQGQEFSYECNKKKKSLLFRLLQNYLCSRRKFKNNGKNKSKICFRENEKKQSYEQSGVYKKNDGIQQRKNFSFKGWKWSKYKAANNSIGSIEASYGIPDSCIESETFIRESSKLLQGRFSVSGIEISNRSGWKQSQYEKMEVSGQKENFSFECFRMDSIEVYKQGSGQRPEWLPSDNRVYNIHVKDNLNYFANGVLVHNCHHANSKSWSRVINHFSNSYLLGVTATPLRGDGQGLGKESGGHFEEMVLGPYMSWLQQEGFLVYAKVFGTPQKVDLSDVGTSMGDYQKEELAKAMNKATITGDAVDHYRDICAEHYKYNAPAIVFCVNVAHAKDVARQFQEAGYKFYAVDGASDDDYRDKVLSGLSDGSVEGVVSCDIISEGTDIPKASIEIDLRPTKSKGRKIQNDGRVLRPVYADGYDLETKEGRLAAIAASEKPYAIILDHVNNTERMGCFSWDDHEWTLEGEKKKKKKKANAETPIRVIMCDSCFMQQEPAIVCAGCGHIMKASKDNTPKQVEGKLREITEADIKKKSKQEQGQAQTLEALLKVAAIRGYKPEWANQVYLSRQKKLEKIKGLGVPLPPTEVIDVEMVADSESNENKSVFNDNLEF